jgi:hypothetical protein
MKEESLVEEIIQNPREIAIEILTELLLDNGLINRSNSLEVQIKKFSSTEQFEIIINVIRKYQKRGFKFSRKMIETICTEDIDTVEELYPEFDKLNQAINELFYLF